jgi:DNA-binding LacI/PurR family transcriptional regulator
MLNDETLNHKRESLVTGRRPSTARVGIKDVATAAGVSIATVSNALNHTGRLSEATRARVVEIADRLGYRPMLAARAMAGRRTGVLGLALTTHSEVDDVAYTAIPYYSESILAAIEAAHRRGYFLTVIPSASDSATWASIGVDGVVHAEPRRHDPVRASLLARGLPLVSDGRPFDADPSDAWVDNDHDAAMTTLLDHVRDQGATRIGLMLPRHDDFYVVEAEASYRRWCRRRRQAALVAPYKYSDRANERAAASRLLRHRRRVDAVVGIFTYLGYEALAAAQELGLRVPDDVMIACFSEDPGYATTDPSMTTMSLQPRVVSATAVDLLADIVEAADIDDRQRLVPTVLHVRRSTSPSGRPGQSQRRP